MICALKVKIIPLKLYAKEILKGMGYRDSEIFEEYRWVVPCSKVQEFKVDVAGIREKEKIAIEVGATQPDKLLILDLFWDKVIHLPYHVEAQIDGVAFTLAESNAEVEKLRLAINEQASALSEASGKANFINGVLRALVSVCNFKTKDAKHCLMFHVWNAIQYELRKDELPLEVLRSVNVVESWLNGRYGALTSRDASR